MSSKHPTFILGAFLVFGGCAHPYRFSPEVAGPGAMWAKGGVMYPIPARNPAFHLQLTARPIWRKVRSAHLPSGTKMILVRMAINGLSDANKEAYAAIVPNQQLLLTGDGKTISPIVVRASTKDRPRVKATPKQKQVVELFYALPQGIGIRDVQDFKVRWSVELPKGVREQQTTRFDLYNSSPQQTQAFFDYEDDTDIDQAVVPDGMLDDWGWWGP